MRGRALILVLAGLMSACSVRPPEPPSPPLATSAGIFELLGPVHRGTNVRVASLSQAGDFCRAVLDVAAEPYVPVADQRTGPYCGFTNVVQVPGSPIPYTRQAKVTCPVAVALHLWQRDVVEPAARRHFGTTVDSINHYGTYACRTRNNKPGGKPSEHATANAIDIASFRLSNGRRVSLTDGWNGAPDEQAFLREVRDGACAVFQLVLSPDSDPAHADHFHFDMGRWVRCL